MRMCKPASLTFARSAGIPGGQNGRSDCHEKNGPPQIVPPVQILQARERRIWTPSEVTGPPVQILIWTPSEVSGPLRTAVDHAL